MANPQLENGYTRIANEILDSLVRFKIQGVELRTLLFIFRKTYGYGKKKDRIALSQFSFSLMLPKRSVIRALNKLKTMNIIHIDDTGKVKMYQFNKDSSQWRAIKKVLTDDTVHTDGIKKFTQMTPTIDNIQKKKIGATPQASYSFDGYLQGMREHKDRKMNIIAEYVALRGGNFPTYDSMQEEIHRWLKTAKALSGYTDEQIAKAIRIAEKNHPEMWNLGTARKYISQVN